MELTLNSTLRADGTSCLSLAEALSSAGRDMSAMRTLAPSLAKRIHVSKPIPLWRIISMRNNYPLKLSTGATGHVPRCSSNNGVLAMESSHTKAVDGVDFAAIARRACHIAKKRIGISSKVEKLICVLSILGQLTRKES